MQTTLSQPLIGWCVCFTCCSLLRATVGLGLSNRIKWLTQRHEAMQPGGIKAARTHLSSLSSFPFTFELVQHGYWLVSTEPSIHSSS